MIVLFTAKRRKLVEENDDPMAKSDEEEIDVGTSKLSINSNKQGNNDDDGSSSL